MRISTSNQKDDLQRDALLRVGVPEGNIYADVVIGASRAWARPAFEKLLEKLEPENIRERIMAGLEVARKLGRRRY